MAAVRQARQASNLGGHPAFVFMTAAWILVAIAVTLYSGLAYAAIYWILSGFFLFLLAAGLFVFLMKRRQEAKIR